MKADMNPLLHAIELTTSSEDCSSKKKLAYAMALNTIVAYSYRLVVPRSTECLQQVRCDEFVVVTSPEARHEPSAHI